jgi:magnesium transporter
MSGSLKKVKKKVKTDKAVKIDIEGTEYKPTVGSAAGGESLRQRKKKAKEQLEQAKRKEKDDDDADDDDDDDDDERKSEQESSSDVHEKKPELKYIDFAQAIAQTIVYGKRGTRNWSSGGTEGDQLAAHEHDDDGLSSTASEGDAVEDMKDLAEAVQYQGLAERRHSKRQKMKQLRFSFAPTLKSKDEHASDEEDESSSQVVQELNEYHEFLERTQQAIDKAGHGVDKLQILMFGRDASFKSISIDTAVKIGEAMCKGARRNDAIPLPHDSPDNEIVWLDFTNHTADDLEQIRRACGLHPVSIDDCVHQRHGLTQDDRANARLQDRVAPLREKAEFFRRYHLIVTGELDDRPSEGEVTADVPTSTNGKRVGDYSVARVTIVTFAHVVLTFRQRRAPSFLPLVHRLLRGPTRGILKHTNWTALTYMDESMSHMQALVAEMLDVIDMLNDEVLVTTRAGLDRVMVRLSYARRGLMALRVTTLAKRDVFEAMQKHPSFFSSDPKDQQTIADMVKDIDSIYGRLSLGFEVLNHLDDTFLNRINLEVGVSGEAMNKIMKFFSTVATIFLPLTTIGSIWGMNMKVPGESTDESDLTVFFIIVGVMAALALSIVLFLWRKGWF